MDPVCHYSEFQIDLYPKTYICLSIGKLSAKIKNPDSTVEEMVVDQTSPHKFRICFRPKSEGFYRIIENFILF